jgi:hypothetical protein
MPFIVATYVYASSQGQRTHSARTNKISASADGGPRSRVCARETLRSAPHRRERKFSGAHVCRVTFKHLPQPLRSHIWSFGTLGQILKFSKKLFKNLKTPPRGPGGVSEIFWGLISPFFVRINPLWSFRTLTDFLLKFSKKHLKRPKNRPQGARGWGSEFYFFPIIFIIFFQGPMQKFETLRQPLLWFWIAVVPRKQEKD